MNLRARCSVFICSLGCRIRPDKEAEFLGSIEALMKRTRWLKGCFGCRVVAEPGDRRAVTFVTEWADRHALEQSQGRRVAGSRLKSRN